MMQTQQTQARLSFVSPDIRRNQEYKHLTNSLTVCTQCPGQYPGDEFVLVLFFGQRGYSLALLVTAS